MDAKEQGENLKDLLNIFAIIMNNPKIAEVLPLSEESIMQGIEENKKIWQKFASKLYQQRIEDLTKKIEQLKAENEAVKCELRVKDVKEVLQYYEKTGTEIQKEAMQEYCNLGQSIEQHINNLKKENEQLKERIETIRRQSAAQGTKQVLKSCDITLML